MTIAEINRLEKSLEKIDHNINGSNLPTNIIRDFMKKQKVHYNKKFRLVKKHNFQKLDKLKVQQIDDIQIQDKLFKNLSNTDIPINVKKILALGPKFSISRNTKEINIPSLLEDLENIIHTQNTQQKTYLELNTLPS